MPTSDLLWRLFVAGCALPFIVVGSRMPKLPPLQSRWPSVWSLGTPEQLAISRLAGWLLVSLGMTMIFSVLFLSWKLFGLVIGSVGIATLVVILLNRFGPIVTKFRGAAK